LSRYVDSLIVVPNQKLLQTSEIGTSLGGAFRMADDVLCSSVRSVSDLILLPGLINVDFADARAVLHGMGKAVIGSGEAGGKERAIAAAQAAITNPLLEDSSIKGASRALINICGGHDLTLVEVDEAAARVRSELSPDALIILDSTLDEVLDGHLDISVIAKHVNPSADVTPMSALHRTSESSECEAGSPSGSWRPEADRWIDAKPRRAIPAIDLGCGEECAADVSPACSIPGPPSADMIEVLSTFDYLDQIPNFLRRRN
jgi:cell division protein FtsZ